MIRVQVIEDFTLNDYDKIKDTIKRARFDTYGSLYVNDTFECDKEMYDYLTKNNRFKKKFVKVIEWKPESKK